MEKNIQDLAWKCLPKEAREEIKRLWELDTLPVHPDYDSNSVAEGAAYILTELFGYHNLTSDEEPTELLFVERKKVQELYARFCKYLKESHLQEDAEFYKGEQNALILLFGDKCLPDKEPSVQGEPKFKVGELIMSEGKVGRVLEYDSVREFPYLIHFPFNNSKFYRLESELAPYTEPETKDNMEEKNKLRELFSKENLDEIVSSILEYTAVITQDVINEASKYKTEEERIFIKGAAWMLYHLVKNRGQRHIYIDSDMSLDEAIQHCEEVLPLAETAQCAREHVQLRDWLTELKQRRENKQ